MPNPDPPKSANGRPLMLALLAHRNDLMAYVDRHLPPSLRATVDPADVVQDVCYDALRREGAFDPVRDPSGRRWLFTIARRRIIRLMERHRVGREVNEAGMAVREDDNDSLVMLLGEMAVYERTPSQSAASHETWVAVSRSMGRLSPDQAAVIRSRYFDQLPAADLAQRTGRSLASVDQMLYRAMTTLRSELRSLVATHA